MKIQVVVVGKVRGSLQEAVDEYERRASRYWKLEVVEVPGGAGRGAPPAEVMAAEAERIRARLGRGLELVAMTREGKGMDSKGLADYLDRLGVRSSPGAAFIIGGAFGLAPDLVSSSRRTLSLSAMTLPHEMARLVLAEQLYRAGTILRGEPYHKG